MNKDIIYALKTQIAFEKEMYKTWKKGEDLSLQPKNWTVEQQGSFVGGMKHALNIIREYEKYL